MFLGKGFKGVFYFADFPGGQVYIALYLIVSSYALVKLAFFKIMFYYIRIPVLIVKINLFAFL